MTDKISPFQEYDFRVSEEQSGQRLDLFLSAMILDLSRSHLKRLINEKQVVVNGTPAKPSHEIRAGDSISVKMVEETDEALRPTAMHLDILYEDQDLIIVNKPPGLVVHPGAGHPEGTLVHGLLSHCTLAIQGAPLRPGIVHRLDKDTSGALVAAKSERAYLNLIGQFKEREVKKEYLAMVYGHPDTGEGEISSLLGRHPTDRKKIAVLSGRGRPALSLWRVVKDWGETSLLSVRIETGRTHQIRVHLSHIGHPVIGDEPYGGGGRRAKNVKCGPVRDALLGANRQMLHAARLEFSHPVTGAPVLAIAPPPEDFKDLAEKLEALSRCRQSR
ncbi:MAG: RluA family pseudouridine synthase [Syntrophobacteraceae bacterium]|nr:RluA family pseudouridine synthase [Syntrophobacteraceae bacterium]